MKEQHGDKRALLSSKASLRGSKETLLPAFDRLSLRWNLGKRKAPLGRVSFRLPAFSKAVGKSSRPCCAQLRSLPAQLPSRIHLHSRS